MHFSYRTKGVCSSQIDIELEGNIVKKVSFTGGCNGNLQGISRLVTGMTVQDITEKLKGVQCGFRDTSCPDQLAQAVAGAYQASLSRPHAGAPEARG